MIATENHRASFDVNPDVEKGDKVTFKGLDSKNSSWFIGVDSLGRKGYFPVGWFQIDDRSGSAIAGRDYNAKELSISAGDHFEVEEEYGGWLFVATCEGRKGWIPTSVGFRDEEEAES